MPATFLARAVSILGHPAITLPLALTLPVWQISSQTSSTFKFWLWAGIAGMISAGIILWSYMQVRRGTWAHVDASRPGERRQLNNVLLGVFLGGTLISFLFGLRTLGLGLLSAAFIISAAMLIKPPFKLSHHVAFSVFAFCAAAAVHWQAALVGGVFICLMVFSRLHLGRHSRAEVFAGLIAGACAGCFYYAALSNFI